MRLVGMYGAGGHGREIMPLLRENERIGRAMSSDGARLVFIDDALHGIRVNDHDVLSWDAFAATPAERRQAALAIGNSRTRAALAERCRRAGVEIMSVRAPNAVVLDAVEIGEGEILSPFVTITSNVRIGRLFQANTYCSVAHDCVIGDCVTFAPGVRCNGNVTIGDHAYIGSGAILRNGQPGAPLVIGAGAVVGMGAVVTKDVPPGVTVVGNPARPLVKDG